MIFNFFKKTKGDGENPFTKKQILDRRIEKFNYCKRCNNKLNLNTIEKVVENGEELAKVKCDRCTEEYLFRNWDLDKSEQGYETITGEE